MRYFGDFTGKTALITGGSRGLGRAISLSLAKCGANVVVASRKLESCEAVVANIREKGGNAMGVQCHVGKWEQLETLVTRSIDEFGRIDILVNNAGMSPIVESSIELSDALFDKIIGVNAAYDHN